MNYQEYFKIANVTNHSEFREFLKKIITKKEIREEFYRKLIKINNHLEKDTFREYFELYAAERKTNKQDFTPDSISEILAKITQGEETQTGWSAYDPTAGTGGLIIKKWWEDLIQETPFSYAPHRYLYRADEISDDAIIFLIHNIAMRGMNCIVVHGDVLEGRIKNVYFLQNDDDDYLHFSSVNIMPRTKNVEEFFCVKEWKGTERTHIESGKVILQRALPMRAKKIKVNENSFSNYKKEGNNIIRLEDVANVERVKKNKIYPTGTVVVQISATKGQIGLLKSNGEIEDKYVAISFSKKINPLFGFYRLKETFPKHLKRVQEGLNISLEDVKKCPFSFPGNRRSKNDLQTRRD